MSDQPRTDPPATGIDPHDRFLRHSEKGRCPECGSRDLDVWISEGATSAIFKCVDCETEVQHRDLEIEEGA